MNEQRIREIAEQSSYHAENSVDYYSGIVDGLTWEAKILKARDLKFAELIIKECGELFVIEYGTSKLSGNEVSRMLRKHFGVEE